MPSSEPTDLIPVTTTPDDIAEETVVTTVTRLPGAAVESAGDKAANDAVRAEGLADTLPVQPDPIIDTRSPLANLASRDNIVADGAGTAGESLV